MKYLSWFIVLLAFGVTFGAQDNVDDVLLEANRQYQLGDYNSAILLYESMIDMGVQDSAIYFNLGSAYYQTGALGFSLVNFRRAERFIPRDHDLNIALGQIRSERIDLLGDDRSFIDGIASLSIGVLSVSELWVLILMLWTLWLVSLSLFVLMPSRRLGLRPIVVVIGVLFFVVMALGGVRWYVEAERPAAVVVVESTDVYSGADDDYLVLYRLSEAAEVRVLGVDDNWIRIVVPDGRQGWIFAAHVSYVNT